jgi:hypothetical protein
MTAFSASITNFTALLHQPHDHSCYVVVVVVVVVIIIVIIIIIIIIMSCDVLGGVPVLYSSR